MKPRHFIAFGIVVLFVVLALGGCGVIGTDIPTRIGDFVNSLNGDRTLTYENLVAYSGPWSTTKGSTTFWDTQWSPTQDGTLSYTITSSSPYDATGVLVDVTGSVSGPIGSYKFVLTNTGSTVDDYAISDIQVLSGRSYVSIFN